MKPSEPDEVKVFFSLFSSSLESLDLSMERLKKMLGDMDYISPLLDFDFTDYYEEEFGKALKRYILSLTDLQGRDCLVRLKWIATDLEMELAKEFGVLPKRIVDIDPGYISPAQLVLASHKDFSHRIYLGDRVYADLTLIRQKKEWKRLEWTYPDYAGKVLQYHIERIREIYMKQLKDKKIRLGSTGFHCDCEH